jgi:hypothetical protein
MLFAKLKAVVLSLGTLTIVSSAIVLAQTGPVPTPTANPGPLVPPPAIPQATPSPPTAPADEQGAVERKLDRILDALDRLAKPADGFAPHYSTYPPRSNAVAARDLDTMPESLPPLPHVPPGNPPPSARNSSEPSPDQYLAWAKSMYDRGFISMNALLRLQGRDPRVLVPATDPKSNGSATASQNPASLHERLKAIEKRLDDLEHEMDGALLVNYHSFHQLQARLAKLENIGLPEADPRSVVVPGTVVPGTPRRSRIGLPPSDQPVDLSPVSPRPTRP